MSDWGAPVAWDKRSDDFGALSAFDDGRLIVAMEYAPKAGRWDELRTLWMELSPHPHLLDPLEAYGDDGLLLRYAAINWGHPPLYGLGTAFARRTMAGWIHQLAGVYRHVAAEAEPADFHRFACPNVKIDISDAVRVGFWPVPERHVAAPETDRRKPKWDERTLVYIVGQTLQTMVDYELVASTELGMIIGTCVAEKPAKRYQTLAAVQEAARAIVPHVGVRDVRDLYYWSCVEEGFGWLAIGDRDRAYDQFIRAKGSPYNHIAQWGIETVEGHRRNQQVIAQLEGEWVMKAKTRVPRPGPAIERYDRERFLARARDSARSGDPVHAVELAERVLRGNADDLDAIAIVTDVLLRVRDYPRALEYADQLVTRAADVGRHHYRRGKALFGLGRLPEARDVFDLALSIDPKLLEAFLVRREVERTMRHTRAEVGTQNAPVIELPDSLAPLRDVIAAGKPRAIIDALSEAAHAENLDAQLMLARYLALDGEPDRASTIYDRLALGSSPHRQRALVGKAGLLLEAGAHESALSLFDVVCAESPSDLDACEGRAQTLERLGRLGEAAAEYRRFVGLANARADLRVRVAQQWLDAHVL